MLQNLILQMMRRHIDFDLIEEPQLQKSVRDGSVLRAGKMSYKNIVCCSEIPLAEQTIEKIKAMDIFCENDISKIPALGAFPEELLVIKRVDDAGDSLWLLQNLSGEPMSLAGEFPEKNLAIVDAATETAVFCGDGFPDGFVLPHGKLLLLAKNWNGAKISFTNSIFVPPSQKIPLVITAKPAEKLGDLAQQGFSGQAGVFTYEVEFEVTARIIALKMTGGVAEVELNGKPLGICWGSDMLSASGHKYKDKNKLIIRFANTSGNIYGKQDSPFGIDSIEVFR